jgi:hypothetical protein
MPRDLPMTLPADASLYLFTYAKSPIPLAVRLSDMAQRANLRYGPGAPTLVVAQDEFAAYAAAQVGQETVYHLLPSMHLGADQVGVLVPTGR